MAGEQLVKTAPSPYTSVALVQLGVVTNRLFRRHVTGCAHHFHRARDRTFRFDQPRQSEIGQMRFAFCIQQNVPRLDVSMQYPVLMRVMDRARQLCD